MTDQPLGIACSNRISMIEIEETYFDVACRRIAEALRQPDMFVEAPPAAPEQIDMLDAQTRR